MTAKQLELGASIMLSIREAAAYIGLSVPALYRLIEARRIEHYRTGPASGKIRFSREQLDAYLQSCLVPVKSAAAHATPKTKVKRESPVLPGGKDWFAKYREKSAK